MKEKRFERRVGYPHVLFAQRPKQTTSDKTDMICIAFFPFFFSFFFFSFSPDFDRVTLCCSGRPEPSIPSCSPFFCVPFHLKPFHMTDLTIIKIIHMSTNYTQTTRELEKLKQNKTKFILFSLSSSSLCSLVLQPTTNCVAL